MGAVAWGQWPAPRFPSPLIEPDLRRYRIRLFESPPLMIRAYRARCHNPTLASGAQPGSRPFDLRVEAVPGEQKLASLFNHLIGLQ